MPGVENRWRPDKRETPVLERRFAAMFEAARALLKEEIGHEDLVIPTLAFAGGIDEGFGDMKEARRRLLAERSSERWEAEADRFVRACPNFRPVGAAHGAVILERLPVSITVRNYAHPQLVIPGWVIIYVTPSHRMAEPEHVATLYEKVVSDAGIACTESLEGRMDWRYGRVFGNHLLITVENKFGETGAARIVQDYPERKPVFPHPWVIRQYYRMLMGSPEGPGFAKFLVGRSRGRAPSAVSSVPACVAAHLRYCVGIEGRKEVHKLLNEHLLREIGRALPEEGYSNSAVNQLWRDVEKVQRWVRYATFQLFG